MLRYWNKILSNKDSLIYKFYCNLVNDCENNIKLGGMNWAFHVKRELDALGLSEIWQNQFFINIPFQFIKQRMIDQFKQQWLSRINSSNRLKIYARIKHTFDFEDYLDKITIPKFRNALTKLRVSAHNLAIETGRHIGLDETDRKCKLCTLNAVESEYHFLLVCPLYSDLRSKYFPRYYCHWPTLNKLDCLLTQDRSIWAFRISKFIYFANLKRQTLSQ